MILNRIAIFPPLSDKGTPRVLFLFILLVLLSPFDANAEVYQYKDKQGVTVFTNDPDAIPPEFRNSAKNKEDKGPTPHPTPPAKGKKLTDPIEIGNVSPDSKGDKGEKNKHMEGLSQQAWLKPLLIKGGIVLILILLLLCIKLWIKNLILKFIARIAIKVALVALTYLIGYHLFTTSSSMKENPVSSVIKEVIKPATTAIDKGKKNVDTFNEKQKEQKKALDAIHDAEQGAGGRKTCEYC